jgi:hypothetical protein
MKVFAKENPCSMWSSGEKCLGTPDVIHLIHSHGGKIDIEMGRMCSTCRGYQLRMQKFSGKSQNEDAAWKMSA